MRRAMCTAAIVFLTASMILPVATPQSDPDATCRERLERLAAAITTYQALHEGGKPQKLSDLYSEGLITSLSDFVVPGSEAVLRSRADIDTQTDFTLAQPGDAPNILVREKAPRAGKETILAATIDGKILTIMAGASNPAPARPSGFQTGATRSGPADSAARTPSPSGFQTGVTRAGPSDKALTPVGPAQDDDVLYAVAELRQRGVYEDPARLFSVRFPGEWRVVRKIEHEEISYTFSPEAGRTPPAQIRTGVSVITVVLGDLVRRQRMTATEALKLLLPSILRDEPGTRLVSDVSTAKLGTLDAARCTLEGPREKLSGEYIRERYVAIKDGVAFQVTTFAPKEEYESLRPVFLKIAADSRFGRTTGLPRREQSIEARQIVEKYKASVVSIMTTNDRFSATGSGFIISREGYVLTNYHVAYDVQTGQPNKTFMVEWDESLRRPKVPAQLIGGIHKVRESDIPSLYGIDVALLRIAPGDYEPMPLSSLADVQAGDDIVTLGFPSRGMLEGVSLTVTKGVVTRFNRGPQGEVESIFTDAAFTHGSSGGPSVSLVTGGVVGLNTFGNPIQLDPQRNRQNDLINYRGIVPIDVAVRAFPLFTIPGLDPQANNLDFFDSLALARYFLSTGSLSAAETAATQAASLQPQQALAHMQLGEIRVRQAAEAQEARDSGRANTFFDAARKFFEQALQRDPRHSETLAAYARMEMSLGRLNEASALASRAVQSNPKDFQAHLLLADLHSRRSNFNEALAEVRKAKEITGTLIVNAFVAAANIYTSMRDFENARKEWAEAARISPVYLPARLGAAAYFENAKQFDQALAEYNKILGDFPENPEVIGRIGVCQQGAGRLADAERALQYSRKRSSDLGQPAEEFVLVRLADILMGQAGGVDAIPVLAQYLGEYPNGQGAAAESLNLAAIHKAHQSSGLAAAHARLAVHLSNVPEIASRAQQFPMAPLSMEEIQVMLQFQYPPGLAVNLIINSRLAFARPNDQQFQQLQQQGIPGWILQAIQESADRNPPMAVAGEASRFAPPGNVPPVGQPPGGGFFPPGDASSPMLASLQGTWVADGPTSTGSSYHCMIMFGSAGAFSSGVWVGGQITERMSGAYRLDNGRLILMPEGAAPFDANMQMQNGALIITLPNFGGGVTFTRQAQPGTR
jgi:tetratricopeptide (TPR) repeat protein